MEGIISSLVRFEIRHFKKKDEIFPPFLWHSKFEWYLCGILRQSMTYLSLIDGIFYVVLIAIIAKILAVSFPVGLLSFYDVVVLWRV